jgi:uncharacterized Zn finger protein (UPF0148 family)
MNKTKFQHMPCPFCKSIVEVDIQWAMKNGLVFCGTCCKSFPVKVYEQEEAEVEEQMSIPETVEEKWDAGIKEILTEEDEPTKSSAYNDDYSWGY